MLRRRKGGRDRIVREFGMLMYTLLYLKWIANKEKREKAIWVSE